MKTFLAIIYWFLIVISLIQFIPVNKTNKPVVAKMDFVKIYQTPTAVQNILKKACYDCHSNETVYPDYAHVAPISWSIKNHVNEGRDHLNLSEWGTFNKDLKKNMLERSVHSVKDYTMPLPAYISKHPTANLSKAEREILAQYFEQILTEKNY